jgi:hypothetical protein
MLCLPALENMETALFGPVLKSQIYNIYVYRLLAIIEIPTLHQTVPKVGVTYKGYS